MGTRTQTVSSQVNDAWSPRIQVRNGGNHCHSLCYPQVYEMPCTELMLMGQFVLLKVPNKIIFLVSRLCFKMILYCFVTLMY